MTGGSGTRRRAPQRWVRRLGAVLAGPTSAREEPPPVDDPVDPDLVPVLTELGVELLDAGQATNEVEDALRAVSAARGHARVRSFVVPTGILVQVDQPDTVATHYQGSTGHPLRLDQVGALDGLTDDLVGGRVTLGDARKRLAEIASSPPRFGPVLAIVGHTLLTLGFGLCQNPSGPALVGLLLLGALVGTARVVLARSSSMTTALPVLASFVVTVLAVGVLGPWLDADPLTLIAPPLISFLPGTTLTTATIELTHNQVVSGASRLVYGLAQLLLLAFGVVAGVAVVGPVHPVGAPSLGAWAAYVGVAVVAAGHMLYSSAPRGSLPWIALALYAAFVAQALGSVLLSPELSGFAGGLVLMIVAELISRARSGPSRLVTALPGFWLLVPGALGFLGVSEVATSGAQAITELVDMVLALFSVALGVLTGTGLSREASSLTKEIRRPR